MLWYWLKTSWPPLAARDVTDGTEVSMSHYQLKTAGGNGTAKQLLFWWSSAWQMLGGSQISSSLGVLSAPSLHKGPLSVPGLPQVSGQSFTLRPYPPFNTTALGELAEAPCITPLHQPLTLMFSFLNHTFEEESCKAQNQAGIQNDPPSPYLL